MNPGQEIPLVVKDLKVVKNFIWDAYTKWYHLGVELELDPSDLEAIRTKFNNDPAECFNQVLLDWLRGKGSACTWKNLATALKAPPIKFSSLSEGIEKKYCKAGAQLSCSNCPTESNKTSAEVEALFPYLSKDMPEHIRTNFIFLLSKDTDDIKNKFIALETRLRRALKSETTAEEIIRIIARKDSKFCKVFKDCDTIDKLLDGAEQHWSFFDYDLIQLLIGCIFEDEHHLMIRLKAYAADFKEYAKRRICECPSNVFEDEKKNGKVMVFKIEECNFETMTVDELKKLCFCLNSAVTSSYNLRLLKTDPGCIQLTFRAMPSADNMIQKLTREEQQALRKMGVLSITYGEETLNLVSLFGEMAEHEDDKETAKNSTSDITAEIAENPPSPTLSLEEPMAALQVKGDDEADSAFYMISDTTGKSVATHPTYGGSILTSGLGTDISDESKKIDLVCLSRMTVGKQIFRRTEVHIQAKYQSLENDMITLLEERNVEFSKFSYFGNMFFPPELVEGAINARDYLEKARISKILNPWNYFPLRDIMLRILKEEDCQRVETAFADYHDDLNNYLSVTSILNFLHDRSIKELLAYPTCDLDSLSLKLVDVNITKQSLKYIQDLWKSLSGYLRLNQPTVLLQSICEHDHIEINWLVSSEISSKMCEVGPVSKEFFTQHHITQVLINEECIYDEEIHANLNISKARHSLSDACKYGKKMEIESLLKVPGINIKEMQSSALVMTAGQGHLNIVKFLMNSGAEVNAQDETGCTALISASAANHIMTVKYLLDMGANSDIQENEKGFTALHAAAEKRNPEIVKYLIEFSSTERDIDIEDKEGNKPMDIAMKNGHQEIVKLLGDKDVSATCVDEDADKRDTCTEEEKPPVQKVRGQNSLAGSLLSAIRKTITPFSKEAKLMRAARAGSHEEVEKLLKMGAKPNHREADSLRWTPLMWASQEGHTETVKCLLQYGADPNKAALNGFTPLILASRTGQCETVKALLDPNNPIKTEVNMRNKTRGWSALMWAAQSRGKEFKSPEAVANRLKVAKYLLDAGADVNLQADNGWTPLMQASQDGCTELVKILCKIATIDHQSKGTWTALTTACRKGSTDIIKVLVEAGADVNKKKKGGVTAVHIASYKNLVNAMESIVSANADINIKDDWGMTPLILAVKQKNKEMIRYLIKEVKVNVNIIAEKYSQWSALFFAIENKDQDTVDLLLESKADVTIMDEHKHTILSYSKGLFTRKMMYKHLLKKLEHSLPPEEEETQAKYSHSQLQKIESSHSVTPLDQALYTARDLLWKLTQLECYDG